MTLWSLLEFNFCSPCISLSLSSVKRLLGFITPFSKGCGFLVPKIAEGTSIKLLDGTIINAKEEQITNMIYSDYTNINIQIIENHNMDLSLFYEEFQKPKTIIDEIPIDKLDILINKMGIIIENSKQEQTYSFDTYLVEDFIKDTVKRTKEVLETKY